MSTRVYAMPVEQTEWRIPGHEAETIFTWEYDDGRDRLLSLYEKGKERQWNTQTRIDWTPELDPGDQEGMPDAYVPIYGSPTWEKLSRDEKNTVRHHMFAWVNSQFLHGEQGALVCTAKIVETVPDIDSKFYAATQVMDEARHVETYAKLLIEKVKLAYPINPHLKTLLDQTISDSRWDMTYLGMQVMIEGVALAAFSMFRDFGNHPLTKAVNAYVMQDEARHVAFGQLALKDAYAELSDAERREREEFVVEASLLLRDRFLAREVWATLGFDVEECVDWMNQAELMKAFRIALFSRVVPTVKKIGLWGPAVQKGFLDMGVIDFQNVDTDAQFDQDDQIAQDLEQALAEIRGGNGNGQPKNRTEELAAIIVAGEG